MDPFNVDSLLDDSFLTRLGTAANLTHLLIFLERSKFGSLILENPSHEDFVRVGNKLKLFDLSGLNALEPLCGGNEDCMYNEAYTVECSPRGVCEGYNAKVNLINFNKLFFKLILKDKNDIPLDLVRKVMEVQRNIDNLFYTSHDLLMELKAILNFLKPQANFPSQRKGVYTL